jgi:CBS domain-containing protein
VADVARLPVHTRLHVTSSGEARASRFVRCPGDGGWVSVAACRRCGEAESVGGADGAEESTVVCALAHAPSHEPRQASIMEAMSPRVLTVDAGVRASDAEAALAEGGVSIAVVVDEAAHPIGVCSRRDIERAAAAGPASRVNQCMTPFVITLLAEASVADAIDLITDRSLPHVPVLSSGRIVGLVSAESALRWLSWSLRDR